MRSKGRERELSYEVDRRVEDKATMYAAILDEEAMIERRMSDIGLREKLIECMDEIIRCRKMSERFLDETGEERVYEIRVIVSPAAVLVNIVR